jgi:riboflavin synthase
MAAETVLKGSVAIDGVSLTVSDIGEDWLAVDLIPVTAAETILGGKKPGDEVNLEGDIVGKYIAKKNSSRASSSSLTEEALVAAGFL